MRSDERCLLSPCNGRDKKPAILIAGWMHRFLVQQLLPHRKTADFNQRLHRGNIIILNKYAQILPDLRRGYNLIPNKQYNKPYV